MPKARTEGTANVSPKDYGKAKDPCPRLGSHAFSRSTRGAKRLDGSRLLRRHPIREWREGDARAWGCTAATFERRGVTRSHAAILTVAAGLSCSVTPLARREVWTVSLCNVTETAPALMI